MLKKQTFKGVGAFGGYQYLIKSKCASKYLKLERGGWVGKRFQMRLAKMTEFYHISTHGMMP